jgi:hypothetical protein
MIRPPPRSRMGPTTALAARKLPITLTSSTLRQSSASRSSNGPRVRPAKMPALLTRISTPPNECPVALTASASSGSEVTSATTPSASPPSFSTSATVAPGSDRSATTTLAPAAASPTQIARPMPMAPPVTSATEPASSRPLSPGDDGVLIVRLLPWRGVGRRPPVSWPPDAPRRISQKYDTVVRRSIPPYDAPKQARAAIG